jgi:hypothetical protein
MRRRRKESNYPIYTFLEKRYGKRTGGKEARMGGEEERKVRIKKRKWEERKVSSKKRKYQVKDGKEQCEKHVSKINK